MGWPWEEEFRLDLFNNNNTNYNTTTNNNNTTDTTTTNNSNNNNNNNNINAFFYKQQTENSLKLNHTLHQKYRNTILVLGSKSIPIFDTA